MWPWKFKNSTTAKAARRKCSFLKLDSVFEIACLTNDLAAHLKVALPRRVVGHCCGWTKEPPPTPAALLLAGDAPTATLHFWKQFGSLVSLADKTIKLWKVSERDKQAEGYNLKDDAGIQRDPTSITSLRVPIFKPMELMVEVSALFSCTCQSLSTDSERNKKAERLLLRTPQCNKKKSGGGGGRDQETNEKFSCKFCAVSVTKLQPPNQNFWFAVKTSMHYQLRYKQTKKTKKQWRLGWTSVVQG